MFLKTITIFYTVIIFIGGTITLAHDFSPNVYAISGTLGASQHVVETIFKDAQHSHFSYVAYASAIYTYDYDYLFQWLGGKYKNTPSVYGTSTVNEPIYGIIPAKTSRGVSKDFISHNTPDKYYRTVKTWKFEDGTLVYKRLWE